MNCTVNDNPEPEKKTKVYTVEKPKP